ncbi:UDP-glucosyltransferase 2-like isoform X1 [Homarus americanus]|uniref:UDP-glucosyltransferase 2-like isoform X1 n=2 Tax=Homarus americanus TaxID=6706 RepID=UPI001C4747CE|nr:UDP-glucosyltransferase 2-like isoform X1 [Homarus americanus]
MSSPLKQSGVLKYVIIRHFYWVSKMRWWVCVAACVVALQVAEAGRILFMAPISSKSHKNFYMGIVNALADHGNQITMVSPYKPAKERPNVREVRVTNADILKVIPNLFEGNKITAPIHLMLAVPTICSDALSSDEIQNLLKEKFDLILLSAFLGDCLLSVVHQLKLPFIYVSQVEMMSPFTSLVGNPDFPSFVVNPMLEMRHPLTFTQRAISTLSGAVFEGIFNYIVSSVEAECRRRGLCPDDMPSLSEMRRNNSLLIINSVETVEYPPRPTVPAAIYCGGIHCRAPEPLPQVSNMEYRCFC